MSRDRLIKAYNQLPRDQRNAVVRITELFAKLQWAATLDKWTTNELRQEIINREEAEP